MKRFVSMVLLALFCTVSAAQIQSSEESMSLAWDPVADVDGYMVYYAASELVCNRDGSVTASTPVSTKEVPPEAASNYKLGDLKEATTYWVTVKALKDEMVSLECAGVFGDDNAKYIQGWPTPRVIQVDAGSVSRVAGTAIPTWRQSYRYIGRNFKPTDNSYFTDYPGLRIVEARRDNARELELIIEWTSETPAGEAKLYIVNHDGVGCRPDGSDGFAKCVAVEAPSLIIEPVVRPGRVQNFTRIVRQQLPGAREQ